MKKRISLIIIITILFFINSESTNKKTINYTYAKNIDSIDIINEDVKDITDNTDYLKPTYDKIDWIEDGTVESKLGTGPLMIHKAGYCPYTSGISYQYYQKK